MNDLDNQIERWRVLCRLEAHFAELTNEEVAVLWAKLERKHYPLNIFTDLLDTPTDT